MKAVQVVLFTAAVIFASHACAQDTRAKELENFAQSVKADKRVVVSQNMQLTEAEAKSFWPVYEAYQKDLQGISTRVAKVIVAYADAWNKGPVSNETAKKLVNEMIAVEEADVKLRRAYLPKLEKTLPAAKVARYLQIENKIRAVIRYEMAAHIPLVQ